MPIRRDLYPVEWEALAFEIKEANNWICQECGVQCRPPGSPYLRAPQEGLPFLPELTVAHYDHDYFGSEIFVAPLCAPCHLRHDKKFHLKTRFRNRRIRQERAGQKAIPLPWRLL